METYCRYKLTEQIYKIRVIQNADTRKHMDFFADRQIGNVNRFQGTFYIPINPQSWKYLHLHVQGQSNQFKVLLFGLSTASIEFTTVVKEVKLMAQEKGIRIHQYVDDWLVRATSHKNCLHHTDPSSCVRN